MNKGTKITKNTRGCSEILKTGSPLSSRSRVAARDKLQPGSVLPENVRERGSSPEFTPAQAGAKTTEDGIFEQLRSMLPFLTSGLAFCSLLFFPAHSIAAASPSIYFSAPSAEVSVGQEFRVDILLDSREPLNAYIVNIAYPASLLSVTAVDNSRSIVDVWQMAPSASRPGSIELKGGSIAPWSGTGGNLLSIHFKAIATGTAVLDFSDPSFYLANGKGTKVVPGAASASIAIVAAASGGIPARAVSIPVDDVPPEITFLAIVSDPFVHGRELLAFAAEDPGSGVAAVSYQSRNWFLWSRPQTAENPVSLPTGAWSAAIEVRDNAGNVSSGTVYDWAAFARGPGIAILLIIAVCVFVFIKIRRRKKMVQ